MLDSAIFELEWVIAAILFSIVIVLVLPKKVHYAINGMILTFFGGLIVMKELSLIGDDIKSIPVLAFVLAFVLAATSKELIEESLAERGVMRWITLISGVILIVLVCIPELYDYGVIDFNLFEYPRIINGLLFIAVGLVAIAAIFFERG